MGDLVIQFGADGSMSWSLGDKSGELPRESTDQLLDQVEKRGTADGALLAHRLNAARNR